jgi:hypothetical protein
MDESILYLRKIGIPLRVEFMPAEHTGKVRTEFELSKPNPECLPAMGTANLDPPAPEVLRHPAPSSRSGIETIASSN